MFDAGFGDSSFGGVGSGLTLWVFVEQGACLDGIRAELWQVLQCIESLYVDKLKPFGPVLGKTDRALRISPSRSRFCRSNPAKARRRTPCSDPPQRAAPVHARTAALESEFSHRERADRRHRLRRQRSASRSSFTTLVDLSQGCCGTFPVCCSRIARICNGTPRRGYQAQAQEMQRGEVRGSGGPERRAAAEAPERSL